ncbi:DNA methylase [Candidatus Stoquefichus massiliensis]|uniref:Y-family DNA polymerase n=1 Tax=Candidatus Stoquefichus massiliensis TaxID=1470350 RepID=UPI0004839912|nr:DNA methylase [Candidatus Stoquefichus massiliensis]
MKRVYIAIDLKSFYASVECVERNLDPLTTHLVVADSSRTEKTICLAISPSLKKYGLPGRARLFEVIQKVKELNQQRLMKILPHQFVGESYDSDELEKNPYLSLSYIIAPPRMSFYMDYSAKIYQIYLKYISSEDIHVYSIDEVFMDVTNYLKTYRVTPKQLASKIILDVFKTTGITATAGIGSNLYLCKVAMDIVAKHITPDENGARIAQLDEQRYREYLWDHQPITDFWRVGRGYQKRLEKLGLYTMGDIAKCSVGKEDEYYNENLLFDTFGVNAELLIDHAWGYESCTMKDIKNYRPVHNSIGTGQVLSCPYDFLKAKLIVKEMLDLLSLDLVDKGFVTDQIVLTVGYDIDNLKNKRYDGEVTTDFYGRKIPKHAHGTANLKCYTASSHLIIDAVMDLFDRIVDKRLFVKRVNISANHIVYEKDIENKETYCQLDIFTDYDALKKEEEQEKEKLRKERQLQKATLLLKKKFGKNAVLKGMNLEEGATTRERNGTIGGHKA